MASLTGHEDTQVVVDVTSTPDPDYMGVPKEVMCGCTVYTSRMAGLYGYKGHTNHRFTYLHKSLDRIDNLSLDVRRSTGSSMRSARSVLQGKEKSMWGLKSPIP